MADVRSKTNEESGSPNIISTNAVSSFSLLDCSNPLAGKEVITKQPKLKQPQQKETKFSVGFFPVLDIPSLDNNKAKGMSFGVDNKFFAHLVKPSVEYDSTFKVGSSSAAGSTTAIVVEEETNWQQGLFECWKTEPKVLATTAVCPELTDYNINIQVSSGKEGNEVDLVRNIIQKMLIGTLTIFIYLYPSAGIFAIIPAAVLFPFYVLLYCHYITKAAFVRRAISERFKIKDFNCSLLPCSCNLFKLVFCEQCHLCQLHSELEYQKQHRGPEAIIFYL